MAKNIASERKHRARVGGMRHELRGFAGSELAKFHSVRFIHGGVHKDHAAGAGDRFGVFGGKLLAGKRADSRQFQFFNRLGNARTDAVVVAQRISVADDEQFGVWCDWIFKVHFVSPTERHQPRLPTGTALSNLTETNNFGRVSALR
jgi:hypothetical protein